MMFRVDAYTTSFSRANVYHRTSLSRWIAPDDRPAMWWPFARWTW